MALLWTHTHAGVTYRVTSAGSSIRLYTNDAFHSQYSAKHLFTGAIWDALSLPALFNHRIDSSLILGLGGGTVVHGLKALFDSISITAIELDQMHIDIAKRWFSIESSGVEIVHADAFEWLKSNRRKYDLIVDDLFLHAAGQTALSKNADPSRPFLVNESWLGQINKGLSKKGMLIQNHLSMQHAESFAMLAGKTFATAALFQVEGYENVILALYKKPVDVHQLKPAVWATIEGIHKGASKKLRISINQYY